MQGRVQIEGKQKPERNHGMPGPHDRIEKQTGHGHCFGQAAKEGRHRSGHKIRLGSAVDFEKVDEGLHGCRQCGGRTHAAQVDAAGFLQGGTFPHEDPALRRAVHEELIEALSVHGTLVFTSQAHLDLFVSAIRALPTSLAKAWEAESTDHSLSLSPTMTQHATAAGIILGTAGYMAPEQAAGQGTDTRADVWSFGVVLWEMLTGSKLFDGETVSHVLAAVLTAEPDLGSLPDETPPKIVDLIARCLRKKPKMRVQAIGDVRIALEEYLADPMPAAVEVQRRRDAGIRRWRMKG